MNGSKTLELFTRGIFLAGAIVSISSCSRNNKQNNTTNNKIDQVTLPQVTMLKDLPDSNKAPVTFLNDVPPPTTTLMNKPLSVFSFVDPVSGKPLDPEVQGSCFFTNLTTDEGLSQDVSNCSMMDSKGNLWFGTGTGASRFDGKKIVNYTVEQGLISSYVTSIAEDRKGNLWFGTGGGGISCYDGKQFISYTTRHGLPNNIIADIKEDQKGNLWFATQGGGVSSFDGNKFTNYTIEDGLANNIATSIGEDMLGNLWFATDQGVSRYDGKKFTDYTTMQGLPGNFVTWIINDKNGNLWFGTQSGVSQYDGNKFTNYTTAQGLVDNRIRTIIEDKNGSLWFGTQNGVSRFDGKNFTNFTTKQGLPGNDIYSITEDQSGNLWFGTSGNGIGCYKGKSLVNFTKTQGLIDNYVFAIAQDKAGDLWFGSGLGINRHDGKSFTIFTTKQGLPGSSIYGITEDQDNNLWFATSAGVGCYDGQRFKNYTTLQGLANNYVFEIEQDKNGNLWFATYGGGLSKFDGHAFTNYTTKQGLANDVVRTVIEDRNGVLWLGTAGGLSRFDGSSFTNYTTKQGLGNSFIVNISEDHAGNLWIGTEGGGLSRFDGKTFLNFSTADGLPDITVTSMVIEDSNIIIGTNYGLAILTGFTNGSLAEKPPNKIIPQNNSSNEELENYEPQFEVFNSSTGYPIKDVNYGQSAMLKDKEGYIWIGTGADKTGLVRFDYSAIHKSNKPPVTVLQNIRIDNENISWYDLLPASLMKDSGKAIKTAAPNIVEEIATFGRELSKNERNALRIKYGDIEFDSISPFNAIPGNLTLPFNHNSISFEFTAIEPARFKQVTYQYFLEGYDKDWNPPTNKTSVTFGNMNEGTYTFKLKAKSPDGIWSEPVSYRFKVLPPWWRTWWFRTLMGICFLFLLYGIYRWRTATLHKQKRVLEQTVQQRTAEVVKEKAEVERQKEKSDELLLNILPSEVAEELKEKGHTTAKSFDEVTVLFSDIKGFTTIAEGMTAQELVKEIDTYFSAFDHIIVQYGLEKIKTIGDAYIAAGGLPENNPATAPHVVEAAIAMQQAIEKLKQERVLLNKPYFELRIGIHTGPVVAGVVGIKKFQYDIWGDTVNLAARMEQSGVAGKINISQHTYELIKNEFHCVYRGKIDAKNKGEIDMYFVEQNK